MKKFCLPLLFLACASTNFAYAQTRFEQTYHRAEQGDPDAEYALALNYFFERHDHANAFLWMKKAAEGGTVFAQSDLGLYYIHGIGVSPNLTQGIYWLKKAADGGDFAAMFNLGLSYFYGRGVEKNPTVAVTWFQKSLALEPLQKGSLFMLAKCYSTGEGVPKDPEKMEALLKKLTTSYYRDDLTVEQDRNTYANVFYLKERANLLHETVTYPDNTTMAMRIKANENDKELQRLISIDDLSST